MRRLLLKFLAVIHTQTLKDTLVVSSGNVITTIFSIVSIFFIARILGPADFGLYISAWAVVTIIIDSVDLAINGAVVKFASQKTSQTASLVKLGFLVKLCLGFILTISFLLISQPLAGWLHPELKLPLLISASFILTTFLFRFPKAILQSKKLFIKDTVIDIVISGLRFLAVLIFYYFFTLTVVTSLVAYLFATLIGLLVGYSLISWRFLAAPILPQTYPAFFHWQKWLTLGYIIAAIHGRIDSVLLLRLAGPETTGIYQAAYRFFMPVMQLAAALSLIFAPRFAGFPNRTISRQYLIKAARLCLLLGSAFLILIPLAKILVNLIFGSQYYGAILPVQILSFGFVAFIAGAPFVSYLIYGANNLKAFFWLNCLQLLLLVSLELLLVPKLAAVGAAWAAVLTIIIINGLTAGIVLWESQS